MEPGAQPVSLQQFDSAVFQALDLDPERPPPLNQLVPLYLELSERHLRRPEEATGSTLDRTAANTHEDLVRLLVFARRTFFVIRSLQELLPDTPVVEHGAAYAPALIASSPRDAFAAVEAFSHYAPLRQRLFGSLGLKPPIDTRIWRPDPDLPPTTHIFAHALFEMSAGSPERALRLLSTVVRPNDTCLLLEPGDARHAHFLMKLRDLWSLNRTEPPLRAPCPPRATCALTPHASDWCHFRHSYVPHPLSARLLASARRDAHRISFSFLLMTSNQVDRPGAHRLLNLQLEAKTKVRADLCTSEGKRTLVALRRTRATYEKLLSATPATEIHANLEALEARGDGLRLSVEEDFELGWRPKTPEDSGL